MSKVVFPLSFNTIHEPVFEIQMDVRNIRINYEVFIRMKFFDIFPRVEYLIIDKYPLIPFRFQLPSQLIYFAANVIMHDTQIKEHSQLQALHVGKLFISLHHQFPSSLRVVSGLFVITRVKQVIINNLIVNANGSIPPNAAFTYKYITCNVRMKKGHHESHFNNFQLHHETNELKFIRLLSNNPFKFVGSITHLRLEHTTSIVKGKFPTSLQKLCLTSLKEPYDFSSIKNLKKLRLSTYNQPLHKLNLPSSLEQLQLDSFHQPIKPCAPDHLKIIMYVYEHYNIRS